MVDGAGHHPELGGRPLDDVDVDDLLRELLSRVHGVLDEQVRLQPADVLEGGLGDMRARAHMWGGSFEVESRAGRGTRIMWSVPCGDHEGARHD